MPHHLPLLCFVVLATPGFAVYASEPAQQSTPADNGFAWYATQFAAARAALPERRPWEPEQRKEIVAILGRCLGVHEDRIPTISAKPLRTTQHDGFAVEHLAGHSWKNCMVAAHLYRPATAAGRLPLVVLCCGHGAGGKQAGGYRAMAARLARMGALVLVPDNIGQGERAAMGHKDCPAAFSNGLSVQGVIAMETIAWVRWAKQDARVDPTRIAAIGNSGGGLLTLLLAAFCRDDLAAVSSSGYPNSFAYIAAKRKIHCHCNILPGVVGLLEMEDVLGCFAPKPLYIFQGDKDEYFANDHFQHVSERVAEVYRQAGAPANLRSKLFVGQHPWDTPRRGELAQFVRETLKLPGKVEDDDPKFAAPENCFATWPAEALTTAALAAQVAGQPATEVKRLSDVFSLPAETRNTPDGDAREIFAQYEAFLRKRP